MRSTIGALAGAAVAVKGKEVIDRLSKRGRLTPRSAEGNTASAVDQVDRGRQPAVCALHRPRQVVDQHPPRDAFLAPVRAGVIELLLIQAVGAMPLARMSLADDHLDEPHPLAVEPIQLTHRGHAAARDRAGIADKVEQHRPPPQVAQPYPLPIGGRQLELRCITTRRQAGAEQLGDHVPHPEVPKVEVLDRVEQLDQPLRSPVRESPSTRRAGAAASAICPGSCITHQRRSPLAGPRHPGFPRTRCVGIPATAARYRPPSTPRNCGRSVRRRAPTTRSDDWEAAWARPYGVPGASLVSWRGLPSGVARR